MPPIHKSKGDITMKIKETTANEIMDSMAKAIVEAQCREGMTVIDILKEVDTMENIARSCFQSFCALANITEVIEGE
jgi:hypothetical protein